MVVWNSANQWPNNWSVKSLLELLAGKVGNFRNFPQVFLEHPFAQTIKKPLLRILGSFCTYLFVKICWPARTYIYKYIWFKMPSCCFPNMICQIMSKYRIYSVWLIMNICGINVWNIWWYMLNIYGIFGGYMLDIYEIWMLQIIDMCRIYSLW